MIAACVFCASLAILSVGCGTSENIKPLATAAEFDQQITTAKGPVLMDFYKNACPTCVVQEAVLEQLSEEYKGQVTFAKFKIREAYMVPSNPVIYKRYNLFWVPTVILFVDGKEKQRWVFNHSAEEFRPAINEALAAMRKPQALAQRTTATAHKASTATPARSPAVGAVPAIDPTASVSPLRPIKGVAQCIPGQGCPIESN
jgi:thioredoxin 1